MPLVNRTFDQLINFTRTTAATFVGSNGLIQTTPQSRNLLTFTEEFDNAAWVTSSATVAANSVAAPDGTMTADTLTASGANGTALQTFTASAVPYTFSVWLRRLTGTGNVQLTVDGTTYATVTLTTAWARFETTLTPSAGSRTAGVRIVTSGDAVYAWGAQLEQASAATDYTRNFGGLFPPRFDYDPVTLAPRGLLIEEQRTNLLLRSEEFDNAAWTKGNGTITTDAVASPDGATTADRFVTTAATAATFVRQAFTSVAADYTASFYVRANGVQFVQILWAATQSTNYANFDLTNGTVGTNTGTAATITAAGGGWYRISMTLTLAAAVGAANLYCVPASTSARAASFTGDGTSGIFLWGAQLEAGAFATSYIPTVASQVTRTADIAAIAAPNFASWYNQNEGTFVADFDKYTAASRGAVLCAGNTAGALENDITIDGQNDGKVRAFIENGGGIEMLNATLATYAPSTPIKGAVAYATNNAIGAAAGALGTVDTSVVVPTVDALQLGAIRSTTSSATVFLNGHIRSIRYYPVRLSDAQLQALTA